MTSDGITVCHVNDPHVPGVDEKVYGGRYNGGGMEWNAVGDRGWLGNPWNADRFGRIPCILMYAGAFDYRIQNDRDFRYAVDDLAGKAVECYCRSVSDDAPPCHLDVIDHYLRGNLDFYVMNVLVPRLTVTRDRLQAIEGVGPGLADRIIEALLDGGDA